MWSTMDINVLLSLIASILGVTIVLGGIVWNLSSKITKMDTKIELYNTAWNHKLDLFIQNSKEWREHMLQKWER